LESQSDDADDDDDDDDADADDCDDMATMPRQNCFQKNYSLVGYEVSCDWQYQPLPIPAPANTLLVREGLQLAEASFRELSNTSRIQETESSQPQVEK